jgi:hypothetical protein
MPRTRDLEVPGTLSYVVILFELIENTRSFRRENMNIRSL